MNPHLLFLGGDDHHLRIPFLLRLLGCGFRISAAGSGDPAPFAAAGLDYFPYQFDRFINPIGDLSAIRAIAKLLAAVRPGLAQSFDTKPNLFLPLASRQVPGTIIVRTINGLGWTYSSRSPLALAGRPIYRTLQHKAARATSLTIFQNREDQSFFRRHRISAGENTRLIPGSGIDCAAFERSQAEGATPGELRGVFGLGASKVVITVTRLTRQKGIASLLAAAALVHEARPDVRFLLAGSRATEGPFAIAQAEIDRHSPYVMAIGPRSDVPALLRMAGVFLYPTEYREGVPRALLEAGLAGLPIVTTNMPGCTAVVRDGWNGFVVPARSPHALAAKILDLLSDERAAASMGRRSIDLVKREFSLDAVAASYAAAYRELIDCAAMARRGRLTSRPDTLAASQEDCSPKVPA
ncbi:MAG: glycosyltransferase [Methylocapsa sp.]|nr:glycosyltransferase [Methylocapsa sp.]